MRISRRRGADASRRAGDAAQTAATAQAARAWPARCRRTRRESAHPASRSRPPPTAPGPPGAALPPVRALARSYGRSTSSTRRLRSRPASETFENTGTSGPTPCASSRSAPTP